MLKSLTNWMERHPFMSAFTSVFLVFALFAGGLYTALWYALSPYYQSDSYIPRLAAIYESVELDVERNLIIGLTDDEEDENGDWKCAAAVEDIWTLTNTGNLTQTFAVGYPEIRRRMQDFFIELDGVPVTEYLSPAGDAAIRFCGAATWDRRLDHYTAEKGYTYHAFEITVAPGESREVRIFYHLRCTDHIVFLAPGLRDLEFDGTLHVVRGDRSVKLKGNNLGLSRWHMENTVPFESEAQEQYIQCRVE